MISKDQIEVLNMASKQQVWRHKPPTVVEQAAKDLWWGQPAHEHGFKKSVVGTDVPEDFLYV